MKKFTELLEEVNQKHAVMSFMRANPPSQEHSEIINHTLNVPGDHFIVVHHAQDNKDNPLSADDRIDLLKKMYPKHKESFAKTDHKNPTIFHSLSQLHNAGYSHATIVTSEPRRQELHDKIHSNNGKFDDSGLGYHFKKIKVIGVGEKDPDVNSASAEMTKAAMDGNVDTIEKHLHTNLKTPSQFHSKKIVKQIRKGLGLNEDYEAELIKEAYFRKEIFNVGDTVETNDGTLAEIISRGPNYVTLIKEGQTFRKWITEITPSEEKGSTRTQLYKESFLIKGYKTKNFTRELAEQFKEVAKHQSDSYAMYNCVICCDKLLGATRESITENFDEYRITYDRAQKYLKKLNMMFEGINSVEDMLLEVALVEGGLTFKIADKQKVTSLIATIVGNTKPSKDPLESINDSVKILKNKKYSPQGWVTVGALLNMATTAGINWNKNALSPTLKKFMEIK